MDIAARQFVIRVFLPLDELFFQADKYHLPEVAYRADNADKRRGMGKSLVSLKV